MLLNNPQRQFHQIPSAVAVANLQQMREALVKTIGENAGKIATVINAASVSLPDDQYLPPKMVQAGQADGDTIKRYKQEIWEDPGRSNSQAKVDFISKTTKISGRSRTTIPVREQLKTEAMKRSFPDEPEYRYLSIADVQYLESGNVDADHLQSSAEILSRQMDMIQAMNLDPVFRDRIKLQVGGFTPSSHGTKPGEIIVDDPPAGSLGYFIEKPDGTIVGSKYFFMKFHNCIQNLWLLNHHLNSGTGKSNAEAIQWLRANGMFGTDFFTKIGHTDANPNIDQDSLMFCLKRDVPPHFQKGMLLAEAAKIYFIKYKIDLVFAEDQSQEFAETVRLGIKQQVAQGGGKYRHMLARAIAKKALDSAYPADVERATKRRHEQEKEGEQAMQNYIQEQLPKRARSQAPVTAPDTFSQSSSGNSFGGLSAAEIEQGMAIAMRDEGIQEFAYRHFHSMYQHVVRPPTNPIDPAEAALKEALRQTFIAIANMPLGQERDTTLEAAWYLTTALQHTAPPIVPQANSLASSSPSPMSPRP